MPKKTALACPDDDYCIDCAENGREEPLNVNVHHSKDGEHAKCLRVRYCLVCGNGSGNPIDCEGDDE